MPDADRPQELPASAHDLVDDHACRVRDFAKVFDW